MEIKTTMIIARLNQNSLNPSFNGIWSWRRKGGESLGRVYMS